MASTARFYDDISLLGFLNAMRRPLLALGGLFLAATLAAYPFTGGILRTFQQDHPFLRELVFLGPTEAFLARLKLALALGFAAVLPFVFAVAWYRATRAQPWWGRLLSFLYVPLATGLFAAGVLLAYYWVVPASLNFFLGIGGSVMQPLIAAGAFVSYLLALVVPFGVAFEMPVVVLFLVRMGWLTPAALGRVQKYVLLFTFILAAVLTPGPDPFSQVLLAVPLFLLYEVSYLMARLVYRQRSSSD